VQAHTILNGKTTAHNYDTDLDGTDIIAAVVLIEVM